MLRTAWQCVSKAAVNTINHDGIEHAGYLAFLGLLALFPFLVFFFSIIGVLGQGETGAALISQILSMLPAHITNALQPRILEIVSGPPQGLLTIAILGAIWTASSAVEGLRTILNRAYHVATPPAYILRRSLSILQLLIFTFVLTVALLLVVGVPLILQHFEPILSRPLSLLQQAGIAHFAFWLVVLVLILAVSGIYYVIPNIRQRAISVFPGAGLVVFLWIGAAYLFTLYLSRFEQVNLIYGSLGGIIAALVFAYVCNIIFIFGAELNYQIMQALHLRIMQREEAVSLQASDDSDMLE